MIAVELKGGVPEHHKCKTIRDFYRKINESIRIEGRLQYAESQ